MAQSEADHFDETDWYPGDGPDYECLLCNEFNEVVICPDDMCRGAGECMHGDGMALCRCQTDPEAGPLVG